MENPETWNTKKHKTQQGVQHLQRVLKQHRGTVENPIGQNPLLIIMKQSISRMLQYGSEFFVKYQFNILSNGFFIYQSFPIRLQSYAILC